MKCETIFLDLLNIGSQICEEYIVLISNIIIRIIPSFRNLKPSLNTSPVLNIFLITSIVRLWVVPGNYRPQTQQSPLFSLIPDIASISLLFSFQAACCLNIWLCPFRQSVSSVKKNFQATSKQGRRLRFGMLTALTNIRSTKVLHHASCIMHHASCIIGYFSILHHASCIMHHASCIRRQASCIMHHALQVGG